jgi:hypothetical protein
MLWNRSRAQPNEPGMGLVIPYFKIREW